MIDSFSQLIFNIYEAFTVAFFLKEKDHLRCFSSVSFANSFEKNKRIPINSSLPGWIIKHNEPLIIPNFDKDESTLGYYGADEEIKSFMGYPMEGKGVIVVDSKKKWVFTDKEKKILANFVTLISKEIERDKRTQDAEDRIEELTAERKILDLFHDLNLSRITVNEIFDEVLALSGAELCFTGMEKNGQLLIKDIVGADDNTCLNKLCPPGNSIASTVMERERELLLPHDSGLLREKPLFFPGEEIKARQFFGFPLTTDDVAIGVIGFVSLSERHLKEKSIRLLRNITTLLSLYYSSLWMRDYLDRAKDFEPVTGSIQFTTFLGIIENMMKKDERFSLLSIKLSNLKAYNRKMGYEFTNGLLRKAFQVMRYCIGSGAFITRKSGGHFYVLLKGGEAVESRNILKILNYTISKNISEEMTVDEKNITELGISYFPDDGRNLWELLDRAQDRKIRAA
ncbi:MAG: cyclic-di-GMP phosphodiesterase [Syntrophorhabdus sp. PtaU1.Bin153]|nr:MAG: cyclic-di-GMP phosphodiesterase [Syntrophorhabdus sp. PtaU1.Bin153]